MGIQKIVLSLLVIFSSLFSHEDVEHPTKVHSASELDYPPFSIVKEGKANGFSVELLRSVLHAMNIEVDFYVDEWRVVKKDLEMGKIDVLPLVGRTPEREAYFDFSVPYLVMHGAIIVRSNNQDILSFEDLKGKTVMVMEGDNAHEFVSRETLSVNIVTTKSYEEALKMLSLGKYDAVVVQKLVGTQLIKQLALKNLKIAPKHIENFRQDFSFAVEKGNAKLLARLNEGLAIVMADGTYQNLYEKWLVPLDIEEKNHEVIVQILSIIVCVLLFIGAIASFWQNSLKKQVQVKTKALLESEEKLKVLNVSLASKIQEAVEEIQQKDNLMIAQSRQAAMGEMISMIAHQWRQPISVIGMIANNLVLDTELNDTVSPKVINEAMRDISEQVEHLSSTIDDFRNFFKPNKEKQVIKISDIVRDALRLVSKSLESHHVVVFNKVLLDEQIEVYRNEFVQVLINFINNAQDAILLSGREHGVITLEARCVDKFLCLNISDNGGGIPQEVLPKLGEPYVSTKSATGTGLGLYMSKVIIEKHLDGTLSWQNETEGACFTIALPLRSFPISKE